MKHLSEYLQKIKCASVQTVINLMKHMIIVKCESIAILFNIKNPQTLNHHIHNSITECLCKFNSLFCKSSSGLRRIQIDDIWYWVLRSALTRHFLNVSCHFLSSQLEKSVLRVIENCHRLSLSDLQKYPLIIALVSFILYWPSYCTEKINNLSTVDNQIIGVVY